MTDEEKKAYDNLIMLKYFTMEKEDKQAIDTILNLIEKQQKEIEELKKPKYLLNAKTGEITTINNSEFISKDKIKEYLNKMEKRCDKPKFSVMKKEIEELLEERN